MSLFKSNGLLGLGSTSTALQEDRQSPLDNMISALKPNGLLGSNRSSPELDRTEEDTHSSGFGFKSNGLLGGARASEGDDDQGGFSLGLQSNGLLGGSSSFGSTSRASSPESRSPEAHDSPPTSPEPFRTASPPAIPVQETTLSSSNRSIRATTFDGKPLHIRRRVRRTGIAGSTSSASNPDTLKLLDVPIHRMLETLSVEKATELQTTPQSAAPSEDKPDVEDTLWVDRYRPRKFTDLLGNERASREAMAWLKQWDWCVFGKNKAKKRARQKDEDTTYEDEYHRPQEKFLLLSGPPGLGKTTLAHVIAKQAGYEVMEINASDARSGNVVDDRIRPTLEAGSTVGSTKPVLVVIDEIDGATGAGDNSNTFVHKLVQLTQVKTKKKQRNGKRDPHAARPILRPIICICNDINASSIAKLRPHALQIRFNKPSDIHTVKRLREICEYEGLKADARALATLVGVAKGDLRGCLNTLQFIKSKKEDVTEPIIRKATMGMKESGSSIQSCLNSLFTPLSKKRVKELGLTESEERKYVGRLYHEIDSCGRETGIATACFGHYTTLRHHDANLSRHERAIEWLVTFDTMSSAMYGDGDFTLHHYLPYTLVPFFPLFKERGGERIDRRQVDWEHVQLLRTNEEIYKTLGRSLRSAAVRNNGDYRHFSETPILQTEFAPLINRIISPPLRPINNQVIKVEERALLQRLVSVMVAIDLRFVRERSEDGQLSYRLEPPIDVFITYDGKRAADIPVSRYAVRHLVAEQVDAKLTERDTEYIEKGKRGKHADLFKSSSGSLNRSPHKRPRDTVDGEDVPDAKRSKLEVEEDLGPTDFFGRRITAPAGKGPRFTTRKVSVEKPYKVTYRFAEGNSAAVRRPVKVAAFL
ncbi:CHTF18 protein [Coprinopsis cinerea AmutBmut pab1-1]|nr:CHTF18 protein [Coprinopsis cinerea AmutBmut pab1-1]